MDFSTLGTNNNSAALLSLLGQYYLVIQVAWSFDNLREKATVGQRNVIDEPLVCR